MPKQGETTTKFKVDISELKKNISDAQRQIRLANAEFKAAAAGMDDWQTSSNGLTAKLGQLRTVLSSQKSILESLKTQYAQVAAEQGENSKGAQELAIKIANQQAAVNKTEKSLNDYEKELKDVQKAEDLAAKNGKSVEENMRELGDTSEKTAEDVKKSGEGFTVLKGALANLAAQGIQMAVSAMKDLAKETWEGVKAAAAYADEVSTLSAQTGISTEKLQEFKYMEDLIDVSTETMTGSMAKLVRNMASAKDGTGNAAEAFKALGVRVTDANGQLRNNQDVFGEVIDALGKMDNETQRDAYAMQIFGKSAQDLNPLIKAGGEQIAALAQEAHDMGYVLGEETLDSLNETQDALDRFNKVTEGVKNGIVAAFGPAVVGAIQPFLGVLKDIPGAISSGDFSGIIEGVKGIADGMIKQTIKEGPRFIRTGASIVRQIILGVMDESPAMVEASAVILTETVKALTKEAPKIIEAVPPLLKSLTDTLIKAAPGLIKAGNALIQSLATSILKTVPVLLSYLPGLIQQIAGGFTAALPGLLQTGTDILLAILDGIIQALPYLVDLIPTIIETIGTLLEEGLPLIIAAAVVLFNGIIEALPTIIQLLISELPGVITTATNLLVKSLPLLLDAAVTMFKGIINALPIITRLVVADLPSLVTAITTTLIANLPLILAAGLELLTGLLTAIVETVPLLISKAPELVDAIIDGILDSMESMKEAGKDLIAGLWEGISASKDWIKGKLTGWVGDVSEFLRGLFGVSADVKVHAASGAGGALNSSGSGAGIVQNTYNTFNQTNNSPKALSRLEIYRQTRNQFDFATGG